MNRAQDASPTKMLPNYVNDAERALRKSEHLVNDGSTEAHSDLRAIREAIVAVAAELGAIRELLAMFYDRRGV